MSTHFLLSDHPIPKTLRICGICEQETKDDADYWKNPISNIAHTECVTKIEKLERKLIQTIEELFINEIDHRHHRMAHSYAIKAVKEKCGMKLIEYLRKNGDQELTLLMNTVGIDAARKYAVHTQAKL